MLKIIEMQHDWKFCDDGILFLVFRNNSATTYSLRQLQGKLDEGRGAVSLSGNSVSIQMFTKAARDST